MMESSTQQHHPDTIRKKIPLASRDQVRRTPARALLSLLDATLAMTQIAIDCDYPTIQEVMREIAHGEYVDKSILIAHNILDYVERLREIIDAFETEADREYRAELNQNLPF